MALPYYPRYPRDFLDGTAAMTFELKGAYAILLDIIYAQDGACPDNDRYVSGLLGCSVRAWKIYKNQLVELGKIIIENGFISNFRADKELVKSRLYQEKMRENGSKPKKNNELQKPKLNQTETETETNIIDKSIIIKNKQKDLENELIEFQELYPKRGEGKLMKQSVNQIRAAYSKAIKKTTHEQIMQSLKNHITTWNNSKFIPLATTWLNQSRFETQIDTIQILKKEDTNVKSSNRLRMSDVIDDSSARYITDIDGMEYHGKSAVIDVKPRRID